MSICTTCIYVDCTKENDTICRECRNGIKYTPAPHVMRHKSDNIDALIEGLKAIRETCREYYDERMGCSNCPLRAANDFDVCEISSAKPSHWKLKCDERQDDRLFK